LSQQDPSVWILRGLVAVLVTILLGVMGTWAVNLKSRLDIMDDRVHEHSVRLKALERDVERLVRPQKWRDGRENDD